MKSNDGTAPLAEALAELRAREGESAVDSIGRVEVDKHGALVLTCEHRDETRWHRYARGTLERLQPAGDEHVPAARWWADRGATAGVGLVSYRPGRRLVLRLEDGTDVRYAKGLRAGRLERAVQLHREASRDHGPDGFVVPAIVNIDEQRGWFELEALDVESDSRGFELRPDLFYSVGLALGRFQALVPETVLPDHDLEAEVAVLDGLAARVGPALGGLPEGWERSRDQVEKLAVGIPEPPRVRAHRDLHDGQLFDLEKSIGWIDFDSLCRADSALDAANLTAHLRLRALQGLGGITELAASAAASAMLEALDLWEEEAFLDRLRFYQATTFLRLALLYSLRPRWQHLAGSLSLLSSRCVEEVVRRVAP